MAEYVQDICDFASGFRRCLLLWNEDEFIVIERLVEIGSKKYNVVDVIYSPWTCPRTVEYIAY